MASYCLRSFIKTLAQVLYPQQHYKKWVLNQDQRPQIQSLFDNATFLQDFLDKSSPLIQERISSLEDQIMEAAQKAADTLESYITDQILSNPKDQSFTIFPPDMGEAFYAFEVAKEEVMKIECASQPSYHNNTSPSVSKTRYPDSKNMPIGVEEDLKRLRSRLTSARVTELDVIPIVGMGGIGKTTLARILYDEFSSKYHFDRCAWVTVSQSYNPQLILRTILACVNGRTLNEIYHQETSELRTTLHKTLFGRRYLIVVDDIWSCEAWDALHMAFPKDNQGSRIILTSRENTLANYVKSTCHEMHLINEHDSWELLRKIVFSEESCPEEYKEVGKRIARNCGGLPLALQVIGGLLSQSERSKKFWEHVAYNVSSLIENTDHQFSGIFSWSFAQLPHYLKPCFLYIGAFPEDHVISVSKTIKLWVAEGFLYPVRGKSLEEAAESHLNALVDRNLITVNERKITGKLKSYRVHDLLRDLCLRKAQEKKFLCVKDSKAEILQEDILCLRHVSVQTGSLQFYDDKEHFLSLKLTSFARSFLHFGYATKKILSCLSFKLSMLRVLDVLGVQFYELPETILQLVNLRYLAIRMQKEFHNSISIFQNLEILIADGMSIAVIVDLPQLRYIFVSNGGDTNEFPYEKISDPHESLQTIHNIEVEILLRLRGKLPNLKKLSLHSDGNVMVNVDLTCFQNLETLRISSVRFISNTIFPDSLKKLTIRNCEVSQSLLNAIGGLPNLQMLIFDRSYFEDSTWEPTEGEFCKLQYLHFFQNGLEHWLATEFHFPALRHLSFHWSTAINEIPNDIGGIDTLEIIEIDKCGPDLFDSAEEILNEQRKLGNDVLQLRLGRTCYT